MEWRLSAPLGPSSSASSSALEPMLCPRAAWWVSPPVCGRREASLAAGQGGGANKKANKSNFGAHYNAQCALALPVRADLCESHKCSHSASVSNTRAQDRAPLNKCSATNGNHWRVCAARSSFGRWSSVHESSYTRAHNWLAWAANDSLSCGKTGYFLALLHWPPLSPFGSSILSETVSQTEREKQAAEEQVKLDYETQGTPIENAPRTAFYCPPRAICAISFWPNPLSSFSSPLSAFRLRLSPQRKPPGSRQEALRRRHCSSGLGASPNLQFSRRGQQSIGLFCPVCVPSSAPKWAQLEWLAASELAARLRASRAGRRAKVLPLSGRRKRAFRGSSGPFGLPSGSSVGLWLGCLAGRLAS